jgi:hypothetical protein
MCKYTNENNSIQKICVQMYKHAYIYTHIYTYIYKRKSTYV